MPLLAVSSNPPFRDQRHMTGSDLHSTPESVEAFWQRWAAQRGFDRGTGLKAYSLRDSGDTLIANVSTGRWVADCPACGGGIALWVENPRACCLTCGTVYSAVDWPDADELATATLVLSVRPVGNQAWRRDRGETSQTLINENIQHGYPIPAA